MVLNENEHTRTECDASETLRVDIYIYLHTYRKCHAEPCVSLHGWPRLVKRDTTVSSRRLFPWRRLGLGKLSGLLEAWFIVDFQEGGGGAVAAAVFWFVRCPSQVPCAIQVKQKTAGCVIRTNTRHLSHLSPDTPHSTSETRALHQRVG